jgi:type II secretory pathway component GspD/PulD (secretin)
VQLKVEAQRTTLNPGGGSPRVAYQVEIDETSANANVVMPLGDTLVLGGLTTRSTTTNRDGVPVLQDLPLLQYLFSSKSTNEIQTSVLILITPRMPAAASAAESGASPGERALRDQFGIAGGASNLDAVLGHMTANTLFRHFRAGDVLPQHWERMDTTGARLRQALDFLYY